MDPAVGLVQAYLHANGYLTVTEFPVLEETESGYRPVTDVDVLAVRLPGAGLIVHAPGTRASKADRMYEPDETLIDEDTDQFVDFIIGEVKAGKAELNRGALRPTTLITALRRFTFVQPETAERIIAQLLDRGEAILEERKVRVRLIAFGSRPGDDIDDTRYRTILHGHCLNFLLGLADESLLKATQLRNPTIATLALMIKSGATISAAPEEPA